MKRKIIIALISLVLIPSIAFAQNPTLPFINLRIEPHFPTTFSAGSPQNINISFDVPHSLNNTYALRTIINNTTETPPVWEGDFNISGKLEITYKTNGSIVNFTLDCPEIDAGVFICFNTSLANYIPPGIPPSANKMILNVLSNPALVPGEYNFTFDVFVTREVGVDVRSVSQNQTLTGVINNLNTTFPDINITVISNETGNVSFTIISYVESFLPPPKSKFVKMFEFEPDEFLENCTVLVEIILYIAPDQLAGIDKDSIDVYYWNGTNWVTVPRSDWAWIDSTHIKITTTHFSIWGIFGNPSAPTPTPAPAPGVAGAVGVPSYLRISVITADTAITQVADTSQTYAVKVQNLGTVSGDFSLSISDLPETYYTIPAAGSTSLDKLKTGLLNYTLNLPSDATDATFTVAVKAVAGTLTASESYKVSLRVLPVGVVPTTTTTIPTPGITIPGVITIPTGAITERITGLVAMREVQIGVGGFVAFIVAIFVIRTVVRRRRTPWRTDFYKPKYQSDVLGSMKKQIKKRFEKEEWVKRL